MRRSTSTSAVSAPRIPVNSIAHLDALRGSTDIFNVDFTTPGGLVFHVRGTYIGADPNNISPYVAIGMTPKQAFKQAKRIFGYEATNKAKAEAAIERGSWVVGDPTPHWKKGDHTAAHHLLMMLAATMNGTPCPPRGAASPQFGGPLFNIINEAHNYIDGLALSREFKHLLKQTFLRAVAAVWGNPVSVRGTSSLGDISGYPSSTHYFGGIALVKTHPTTSLWAYKSLYTTSRSGHIRTSSEGLIAAALGVTISTLRNMVYTDPSLTYGSDWAAVGHQRAFTAQGLVLLQAFFQYVNTGERRVAMFNTFVPTGLTRSAAIQLNHYVDQALTLVRNSTDTGTFPSADAEFANGNMDLALLVLDAQRSH